MTKSALSRTVIQTAKRRAFRELREAPAVRNYMLICLAALFLLLVCLSDRGLEWWSFAPPAIGCLTLLARWSHGPALVLLSLTGLLGLSGLRSLRGYSYGLGQRTPTSMDLILCIAVLAYAVGHYRVLSLTRRLLPSELPQRGSSEVDPRAVRRSADLVAPWELVLFGLSLLIWSSLALLLWSWLMEGRPPMDMHDPLWRLLQIVWAALALLATAGVSASYLRLTSATPEESLMYLQDEVWRHTRREQGVLNRWLTWARTRRRKETP